ncbi:hypothetical protein HZS_3930 [Henneguya salminicola]|nr:hypothetical protein HZS_3930 [Henneguya salminicola]
MNIIYRKEIAYTTAKMVRKGHMWLVGDNATISHDSNSYGDVPVGLAIGRVYMKIYPLKDIKFL